MRLQTELNLFLWLTEETFDYLFELVQCLHLDLKVKKYHYPEIFLKLWVLFDCLEQPI